jgi:hypothetical protein
MLNSAEARQPRSSHALHPADCEEAASAGLYVDRGVAPLHQDLLPLCDCRSDDFGGVVQAAHRVLTDDAILGASQILCRAIWEGRG